MTDFTPGWYVVKDGDSRVAHQYDQLLYGRQWAHTRCKIVNKLERLGPPLETDAKCDQCQCTIH